MFAAHVAALRVQQLREAFRQRRTASAAPTVAPQAAGSTAAAALLATAATFTATQLPGAAPWLTPAQESRTRHTSARSPPPPYHPGSLHGWAPAGPVHAWHVPYPEGAPGPLFPASTPTDPSHGNSSFALAPGSHGSSAQLGDFPSSLAAPISALGSGSSSSGTRGVVSGRGGSSISRSGSGSARASSSGAVASVRSVKDDQAQRRVSRAVPQAQQAGQGHPARADVGAVGRIRGRRVDETDGPVAGKGNGHADEGVSQRRRLSETRSGAVQWEGSEGSVGSAQLGSSGDAGGLVASSLRAEESWGGRDHGRTEQLWHRRSSGHVHQGPYAGPVLRGVGPAAGGRRPEAALAAGKRRGADAAERAGDPGVRMRRARSYRLQDTEDLLSGLEYDEESEMGAGTEAGAAAEVVGGTALALDPLSAAVEAAVALTRETAAALYSFGYGGSTSGRRTSGTDVGRTTVRLQAATAALEGRVADGGGVDRTRREGRGQAVGDLKARRTGRDGAGATGRRTKARRVFEPRMDEAFLQNLPVFVTGAVGASVKGARSAKAYEAIQRRTKETAATRQALKGREEGRGAAVSVLGDASATSTGVATRSGQERGASTVGGRLVATEVRPVGFGSLPGEQEVVGVRVSAEVEPAGVQTDKQRAARAVEGSAAQESSSNESSSSASSTSSSSNSNTASAGSHRGPSHAGGAEGHPKRTLSATRNTVLYDRAAQRRVYDMVGEADVYLPDVRSVRPRAAAAVMGSGSRRGVEPLPREADPRQVVSGSVRCQSWLQ